MKFKKNILLDHFHTFFRSFNVTQGIWLIYLYHRGFSIFEIALFEGIFHVTSLLMEIPTGAVADLFGRKTSRAIGIFMYVLYIAIILNSTSFGFVAIAFVICSLSYVFESGAAEAIVYDSMLQEGTEDNFMKFMGIKEVVFQVSGFLALMVSGFIAFYSQDYNFYVTAIMVIIALFFILSMKEPPIKEDTQEEKPSVTAMIRNQFIVSFQKVFKNKRLFMLILIGAMMTAPVTSIFFFSQNYFDIEGVPIYFITIIIGLHSGGSAIGGLFAHKLEKRFREKAILYFVPLILAISFWLLLIPQIALIPFIIIGVIDSIFYIVLVDYINRLVESEIRATVLSVFGMMFSLVMIVLFTLTGYLIDAYSFYVGFTGLAIVVSLFYVVLLFIMKGNHLVEE